MNSLKPLFLLLCFAVTVHSAEPDWAKFEDPEQVLLTSQFAERIQSLPPAERDASMARLLDSLASKEGEIRRRSALTLGDLGNKSGVPVMMADMSTPDANKRGNIAVALRVLKDKRSIPVLRTALADKSPYVRGIALAALGELQATEAYSEILAHLNDRELVGGSCIPSFPAQLAVYALGALGNREAIPKLVELLDDTQLQTEATQSLKALTGEDFGWDPAQWKRWWADHPPKK